MDDDLDDTHLCIKCNRTIQGLENYIQHRKQNCKTAPTTRTAERKTSSTNTTSTSTPPVQQQRAEVTPAITYEHFNFNEPEPPSSTSHGGKTSKSLGESYDLPYELGADVFFSSLQLQSVQSSVGQTGGKTAAGQLQRQKSLPQDSEHSRNAEDTAWIDTQSSTSTAGAQHSSDKLLKAVRDIGETKKSYENRMIFKPITFEHESPEVSEDEEEDDGDMDDDDEDYDPIAEAQATGGKWKLPLMRHSPPVVPMSHTGGKWKPEHRPNLRVAHTQLPRLSPTWDDQIDDVDAAHEGQHPPSDHTKGKWIPGTKLQRLEYKEVVELAKCTNTKQDYWCNICCRKLKSKSIYENHLKTSYHLKRAEPEQQLEKATIEELTREDVNKSLSLTEFKPLSVTVSGDSKKRKRRSTYLKCNLCKHVMPRHLIGKHLISHYHYRRMQQHPGTSLHMILESIHAIVLQSPFQCHPCRFYANTEETFLQHWNSDSHLDASEGPGRFWCSYCQFECEDNNQMRRHLLGPEHKEVILAINRSVPICISKRLSIDCPKCGRGFRFNFELRRHFESAHSGIEFMGSASDAYQSKFKCLMCTDVLTSQVALQRHEKFKHSISKYFCSICNLEFNSPCKARRHRKTVDHKQKALDSAAATITNKRKTCKNKVVKLENIKEVGSETIIKLEVSGEEKVEKLLNIEEAESSLTCNESLTKLEVSQSELNASIILDELPCTSKEAKRRISQQKSTPPTKTLKCKDCRLEISSREELKLHRQREHKSYQHSCMICAQTFVTAQELGRHTRTCKPLKQTKPEEIKMTKQLSVETDAKGEKSWKCDLCEFSASSESDILYHRILHSYGCVGKNQLIKCCLCEKSFRKHSLRFHLRQHTKEKTFKCEICNTLFSRPYNLKDHINKVHGGIRKPSEKKPVLVGEVPKIPKSAEKTCQCDSCGKIFKSKHSLKMHSMTHHVTEAERQSFPCTHENCEYAGVSKSLLNLHLKSHSVESFKCMTKDCQYVGKSEFHLKRHSQTHAPTAESKLFPCDKCSFKTKIKSHLKRHIRRHTGEKPFPCPHCDFRSTSLENLRKHILKTDKHPGKFVYECKMCEEEVSKTTGATKKVEEIFKTNSHQEYQQHLHKKHKKEDLEDN